MIVIRSFVKLSPSKIRPKNVVVTETDLNLLHKLLRARRVFLLRRRAVPTFPMSLRITVTMRDRIGCGDRTTHRTLVVLMCAQEIPRPGKEEYSSGDGRGLATVYDMTGVSV
jgi:hypothetical protein